MKNTIHKISLFLPVLVSTLAFVQCHNRTLPHKDNKGISGRYINDTWLQQIPYAIAGTIPVYCFELNFVSADSVDVNYGFEHGRVGYKQEGDHYVLVGAGQGQNKNMPFLFHADNTISLMDSSWAEQGDDTWIGTPVLSKFKSVAGIKGQQWVFEQYLNQQMIAGEYQLSEHGKSLPGKVVFMKDGSVSGWGNYSTYSICYSGDCVEETRIPSNIIYLQTNNKGSKGYAFTVDVQNNTISLYNIGKPLKDQDGNNLKGGQSINEKVFELKRLH